MDKNAEKSRIIHAAVKVEKKCQSVHEYFDFLIKNNILSEFQKKYDEKTRTKFINGIVIVDGTYVVEDLDWSRIKAHKFIFINDGQKKLVTDYAKLPTTSDGISGDIPMPKNIEAFLEKNAFGKYSRKQNRFIVHGNLTLPRLEDMNLQNLEVCSNLLWRAGKIRIEDLPKVQGNIYGMTENCLVAENGRKPSTTELAEKHIRFSAFQDRPKGIIRRFFGKYLNCA